MDKIKCPHCGAINQDVTEQDSCWKCSQPLSAAAKSEAPPTPSSPNDAETTPVTKTSGPSGTYSGLQQKTEPSLEERVAARKQERLANRRTNPIVPIAIALVILILILILYFLFFKH